MKNDDAKDYESKAIQAVREIARLSDLAMKPLVDVGSSSDRNKLLLIASMMFLLKADFIDRSQWEFYKFIRAEYLILALTIIGVYYCVTFAMGCWRGWQRQKHNRIHFVFAQEELIEVCEGAREDDLRVRRAKHSKELEDGAKEQAIYEGLRKLVSDLEPALNDAIQKWEASLNIDAQDLRKLALHDRKPATEALRSEFAKAVKAVASTALFVDEATRRNLFDALLRAVDKEMQRAEVFGRVRISDIQYAPWFFMHERLPQASLSETIRDTVAEMDAVDKRFRRFGRLLITAAELHSSLMRSYRIGLWWDLILPVTFFVVVVLAAQQDIRGAAHSAWNQLSPYSGATPNPGQ